MSATLKRMVREGILLKPDASRYALAAPSFARKSGKLGKNKCHDLGSSIENSANSLTVDENVINEVRTDHISNIEA